MDWPRSAYSNGFGMCLRVLPRPLELIVHLRSWAERFDVEVLVVGCGMGNAPCHSSVMPKVGERREAWEG